MVEEVTGNEIPNEGTPGGPEIEGGDDPAIEDRARMQGWMPYEEWTEAGNNPNDWVGPEAFLVKGEFINKLKKQSKKINEMEEVINELAEHNRKTSEMEYQKAWDDLKAQKAQALEEGDSQRAVEIDEEMNQTKENYEKQAKSDDNQNKQQKQGSNPEFEEWSSKPENQWYFNDSILRSAADTFANQYIQSNPNASFQEVVGHVENQLSQELPDRFPKAGGNKKKSSPVNEPQMNSSSNRKSKKKASSKDMSDEQRSIAKKFVRQGVFQSEDEYAQSLYELGEIQK